RLGELPIDPLTVFEDRDPVSVGHAPMLFVPAGTEFVERGVAELLGDFDDPARLSRVEEEVPVPLSRVLDAVEIGQQRLNGTHAPVRVTGVRATKEDHFIDVERDLLTV